jgi:hypothetical protein
MTLKPWIIQRRLPSQPAARVPPSCRLAIAQLLDLGRARGGISLAWEEHMPVLIPATQEQAQGAPSAAPLGLQVAIAEFGATFGQCDQIANYLARYAADREVDIDRAAMRLSAIFNEVLEALYRHGGARSSLQLALSRTAAGVALEVIASADSAFLAFLEEVQRRVRTGGARAWYEGRLARGAPEDDASALALVELMTSGQTTLGLAVENTTGLRLLVTVRSMEEAV